MAVRTSFTAGEVLAAADLTDTFGAKLNLAGGKVLQVVRATDTTQRTTTSTTYVDASISVTITPQKNTSAILLIWSFSAAPANSNYIQAQITDSSNNAISGSQGNFIGSSNSAGLVSSMNLIGYATPATTSAITYKGRFRSTGGTAQIENAAHSTGQLFAIEVSA